MDPDNQPVIEETDGDDFVSVRQRVIGEFEQFEKEFRYQKPVSWTVSLLGPAVVTIFVLVVIYFTIGLAMVRNVVIHAILTFTVFGRLIILGGGESGQASSILMQPWQLFLMVTYMDFMVALFVAFHMGIIFHLPYFGKMLAEFVGDGQYLLKRNPWIRKIAFFGLVLFVIFPTSTTGSVGGSIFGRLLGLGRWTTVLAIAIGSVLGNGLMLFLSNTINQSDIRDNPWVKIVGILALACVFIFLERRYRAMKNRFIEEEKAEREAARSKAVVSED